MTEPVPGGDTTDPDAANALREIERSGAEVFRNLVALARSAGDAHLSVYEVFALVNVVTADLDELDGLVSDCGRLRARVTELEAARDDWAFRCGDSNAGEDNAVRRAETAEAELADVKAANQRALAATKSKADEYVGGIADAMWIFGHEAACEAVRAALEVER